MTRLVAALVPAITLVFACTPAPAQPPGATPQAVVPEGSPATPSPSAPPPVLAAQAHAVVGHAAPDFSLSAADGTGFRLADHKGKLIVLEWFNPGCPFVKYAHGEGPLKDMAAVETAKEVVWVAINSGGAGKQGAGVEASLAGAKGFGMTHPVLIDEAGAVGRAYGAEKTPHVYLIDTAGVLVYAGAIDNAPIGEVDGGGAYVNHLGLALADARAGRPVANPQTKAYGCSVKYAKG